MSADLLETGSVVGRYEVIDHLASGGMGDVYQARDPADGSLVALKVLRNRVAGNPNVLERFRREAKHAARLVHPNIVRTLDSGEHDGLPFLVLEYIDGVDLSDLIRRKGKLTPAESLAVLIQTTRALDHAHKFNVVHRDIKPSNFLLAKQEGKLVVKLLDFGLSRTTDDEEFRVTKAGSTVGTIDYLSPEQARDSGSADVRSDIYSLGCTAYHMLAGHPPFPDGEIGQRVYQHMNVEPPDLRQINPDVSADLWAVIERMLAKKPNDRYQSPGELMHHLTRIRRGDPLAPEADLSGPASSVSVGPGFPKRGSDTGEETDEVDVRPVTSESGEAAGRRVEDDDPAVLGLSDQARREAAAHFQQAKALVKSNRLEEAVRQMLDCCRADPAVLAYRRAVRKISPGKGFTTGGVWPLVKMYVCPFVRADRAVLDAGERLLRAGPQPAVVHVRMVQSAARLGLRHLALWLAEKGYAAHPESLETRRALARQYEAHRYLKQALKMWQDIKADAPRDGEATRKSRELMAKVSIAKGHFGG